MDSLLPTKELNNIFWPEGVEGKLNPKIRYQLIKIALDFKKDLNLEEINLKGRVKITDVYFTGSLANYNWSNESDVDLHLIIDLGKRKKYAKVINEYLLAKKITYNYEHNIKTKGFEVEVYPQLVTTPTHKNMGIYSLVQDKWIQQPSKEIPKLDKNYIKFKAVNLINTINILSTLSEKKDKKEIIQIIDSLQDKLKKLRQSGLGTEKGEFSEGNLIFKILRKLDYLQKLRDLKQQLTDQDLTLETKEKLISEAEQLDEVYYNKEWNITNIISWITEFATTNKLQLTKEEDKTIPMGYGGKKRLYQYAIGDSIILLVDEKVPGAPRLNDVKIVVGERGDQPFSAKNARSITSIDGDKSGVMNMLNDKVKTGSSSVHTPLVNWTKDKIYKTIDEYKGDEPTTDDFAFEIANNVLSDHPGIDKAITKILGIKDPQGWIANQLYVRNTNKEINEDYKGITSLQIGDQAQIYPLGEAYDGALVAYGTVTGVEEDMEGNIQVTFDKSYDQEKTGDIQYTFYSETDYDIVKIDINDPEWQKRYPVQKTLPQLNINKN